MSFYKYLIFSLLSLVITAKSDLNQTYIFPCYYYYEPHNLKPESIPIDLCTHIIILGCVYEQVNVSLARYVETPYNCSIVLEKLSNLKMLNSDLKVVVSMATNLDAMHQIVQSDKSMEEYANSALKLALEYKFDGIDFDWEYPCGEDKFKFTKLLEKFRFYVKKYHLDLKLSAAIGAGLNTLKDCFDLDGLSKNLDFINVMCYDYNTIYNTYTAYASPLYPRPDETGYDLTLNTNFTIHYLIEQNVPRDKIVVGLNAGGHTFQLADPFNKHDFHAPVKGVGYANGWSLYPQLCELIRNGGVGVYDEIAEVFYAYYDDQWANTGDVRSATAKALWAKEMGLAGVFTWCLNWDDLFNLCGHNVTFPIHRAIKKQLDLSLL